MNLLLSQIDWLSQHPKMLPQSPRHIKLQLGAREMTEDGLNLFQNRHVVFFSGLLDTIVSASAGFDVVLPFRLSIFPAEVFVVVGARGLGAQDPVPDALDHEQLLQHGVHVTGRTGVLEADEAVRRPWTDRWKILPLHEDVFLVGIKHFS